MTQAEDKALDEALIDALSDEARRVAALAADEQPAPGAWHRLEARRQARVPARRWGWAIAGGIAGLAITFAGWHAWRDGSGRPLTYQVAGGTIEEAGYVRGDRRDGASLAFSDGTRVSLTAGATLSVGTPGARGARLRVQDGRAHFEVVHRPHAAWTVDAGPYSVEVTGTVFDVRWSGSEEIAEIRLRAGSVRVSGPLLGEHATLRPGQSLIARLAAHEVRIEDERAGDVGSAAPAPAPVPASPSVARPAPATEPTTPAAPAPPPVITPQEPPAPAAAAKRIGRRVAIDSTPAKSAPTAPWAPAGWAARVGAGDTHAIVAEAEQHGVDAVLGEADEPALVALADAARYAGRGELAARALLAQRRRFPGTPAAANAAFFLGRLADDDHRPTAALDWYRRYLAEQPKGAYASEALGRAMLGVARVSGRAAARDMAEQYLERFPNGTYLLHARQILAAP